MIYVLDGNRIISHSVNKSERHPALSEIAKFISLSIIRPSEGKRAFITGEQGNKGQSLRGTGEQRPKFEGNRGTKAKL